MKKLIFILTALLISEILFAQKVDMDKFNLSDYNEKFINDPQIDFIIFKTFSIISANVLFKKEQLTLEEKQIEFSLISRIESAHSLRYIAIKDSVKPDLMFIYDFSNDYKEKYIAPQTYSIPIWSSGNTTKIRSNSGTNFNAYGDLNVNGNINGNNSTTITQSGKWSIGQVERPAYTEGKFFPNFSLTIYNNNDNNKIWEGNSNGTSNRTDFRLAAQTLISHLSVKIPKGSYIDPNDLINNNGRLGIGYQIFNSDGMHFFPVIMSVDANTPADKKGLKKDDVILSINSQSTENKSIKQIQYLIKGDEGTKIDLVIDRKGKLLQKSLIKTKKEGKF